jgi:hypothetical protein
MTSNIFQVFGKTSVENPAKSTWRRKPLVSKSFQSYPSTYNLLSQTLYPWRSDKTSDDVEEFIFKDFKAEVTTSGKGDDSMSSAKLAMDFFKFQGLNLIAKNQVNQRTKKQILSKEPSLTERMFPHRHLNQLRVLRPRNQSYDKTWTMVLGGKISTSSWSRSPWRAEVFGFKHQLL